MVLRDVDLVWVGRRDAGRIGRGEFFCRVIQYWLPLDAERARDGGESGERAWVAYWERLFQHRGENLLGER